MLTAIFAERYGRRVLWTEVTAEHSKMLLRCFRIVIEQVKPYWGADGKVIESAKSFWESVHDRLTMELGVQELSPKYWFTAQGAPIGWSMDEVCKNFIIAHYSPGTPADRFIKERLSFVELAFRFRGVELAEAAADLERRIAEAQSRLQRKAGLTVPGDPGDRVRAWQRAQEESFGRAVDELNERFRLTAVPLNYHNGFLQITSDEFIERQLERPFWELVAGSK